jgi:hypothetical protein
MAHLRVPELFVEAGSKLLGAGMRYGRLCALVFYLANPASALTIVDTTPFADSSIRPLETGATYEQEIKVPADETLLVSLSVFVMPDLHSSPISFAFSIAGYSQIVSLPASSVFSEALIEVGAPLAGGGVYVASFEGIGPAIRFRSSGAQNMNPYPDGDFTFVDVAGNRYNNFAKTLDLAFVAVFVPEPCTALLVLVGLAALTAGRRTAASPVA